MTLTKTTIRQNAFARIYKILTDNLASSITLTNAYPQNNNEFPIVVVGSPQISMDVGTIGASNKNRGIVCNIDIEVYTRAAKDLDVVSDSVCNILESNSVDVDIHNLTIEDGTADYTFVNNNTVRMKPLGITFTTRK